MRARRWRVIHRCQNKTPEKKWDKKMWVTSRTGSVGWDLRKVRVEFLPPNRRVEFWRQKKTVDFRSTPRPCGGCRTWWLGGGADGKVVTKRLCLSLPYVEKHFNSKVIKSFVPELRSRQVFFVFRDSYIWVMNILCIFHIFMYRYVTLG